MSRRDSSARVSRPFNPEAWGGAVFLPDLSTVTLLGGIGHYENELQQKNITKMFQVRPLTAKLPSALSNQLL